MSNGSAKTARMGSRTPLARNRGAREVGLRQAVFPCKTMCEMRCMNQPHTWCLLSIAEGRVKDDHLLACCIRQRPGVATGHCPCPHTPHCRQHVASHPRDFEPCFPRTRTRIRQKGVLTFRFRSTSLNLLVRLTACLSRRAGLPPPHKQNAQLGRWQNSCGHTSPSTLALHSERKRQTQELADMPFSLRGKKKSSADTR